MKKILFILLILGFAAGAAFSQTGDARVRALGGAYTAVADDLNAISMNPAGLGYLKHKNLVLGMDFNVEMKKRIFFGQEQYPYIWESWDGTTSNWVYWDDFLQTDVIFDPISYGFSDGAEYNEWRNMYDFYSFADNTSNIFVIPQAAYVTKNWGVSTISDIGIDFIVDSYVGLETPLQLEISKKQGVMGALGFALGPISLGANVKYYKMSSYTLDYGMEDFDEGPPEDLIQQIFVGPEDFSDVTSEPVVEVGVGTIFTLGTLSAGAYLDNLLFFLAETDEGAVEADLPGIFDTLSVGVAWTPFDSKLKEKKGLLNLIAAVDLKNLGSATNRQLAAGAEIGLNLGRVIMVNSRLGYTQGLPGELSEAFSTLDPYLGLYSIGMGVKVLFMEIDFDFQFPSDMVFDPPMGSLSEERLDTLFGNALINVRISF